MRLKTLEIVGFKSFADRVQIDLTGDVTAFVGPNGCGKSNIVDAIKWVLGEQRVTSLRGDSMHDVIFNGNASGRRVPMNFAEVSLTFSNDCGTLPIEFDEVVVTRRLFRTGESEYLLNRSPVRLKDIKKLFMNTGAGLDAYSIMEQGRIDRILEANPKDRRIIFEEAAGISLFKAQRREAERKLERTNANLLRLGDIIDELEKRIRSLKNQAGRARSYMKLTERIKELRKEYYCHLFAELAGRMTDLKSSVAEAVQGEEDSRRELGSRQNSCNELSANVTAIKEGLFVKRSRLAELKSALSECDGKIAMLEKRLVEIGSEQVENTQRGEDLKRRTADRETELAGIEKSLSWLASEEESLAKDEIETRERVTVATGRLTECVEGIEELENSIVDLSRKEVEIGNKRVEATARLKGQHATRWRLVRKQHEIARQLADGRREHSHVSDGMKVKKELVDTLARELAASRQKASTMEAGLGELEEEIRAAEADKVKVDSRIDLLESLVASREGVEASARTVMDETGEEGSSLSFVKGILGELLDVDFTFSKALEAVLGDLAEAVVVGSRTEARQVLDFLEEKELGGATILVRDDLTGAADGSRPARSLSSHVRCAPDMAPLKEALLGAVRLEEKDLQIDEGGDSRGPCVNSRGDYYDRGILRVGGGAREPGLIARRSELTALKESVVELEERLDGLQRRKETVREKLAEVQSFNENLSMRLDEHEFEVAALSAEQGKVADRMERLFQEFKLHLEEGHDIEKSVLSLNGELRDLEGEGDGIGEDVRARSKSLDLANMQAAGLRNETARLDERLQELGLKIVERRGKREALEKEKDLLAKNVEESRSRLNELERDEQRLKVHSAEVEEEILRLKERTEGMASERSELTEEVEELNAHVSDLNREFDREREKLSEVEDKLETSRTRLDSLRIEVKEIEVNQQNLRERALEEVELDLDQVYAESLLARQIATVESAETSERDPDAPGGDLETVPEAAAPEAARSFDTAAAEREIVEIRQKIARIGNVNLEAVTELEKIEERYDHLVEQREDLTTAQKTLKEMIAHLNTESRKRFAETFEEVRSHFNGIFRKLFHGGRADIRINDGEDILEAGIEIIAGPPRKDVRSISLLSGGERTLTAVALLFALFKARPSPFCFLDEVDAALDETNIERFCSLLKEFLEYSQFLIVTHSKQTMSHAQIIYGITMEVGGVSKLVSMKLEEYQEKVA